MGIRYSYQHDVIILYTFIQSKTKRTLTIYIRI